MAARPVQLRVGGQTYRVVTSASEDELQRLAAVVDQKLATVVPPGRPVTPQAMLLAAISLAHDLEEERAHLSEERLRSREVATRARGAFGRMLERVDAALDAPAARPSDQPSEGPPAGAPALRPVPRGDG